MITETTPQQEAAVKLCEAMGFGEARRSTFGEYDVVWFELVL